MTGRAIVVQADACHLPLPDSSVDLIVTSPPYFALRSYQDGGSHYEGQIGSEQTPAEYLDALWACTAEWMRVLKPEGSMFVNLGDSYSAYNNNRGPSRSYSAAADPGRAQITRPGLSGGVRTKSLHGMPWRYAIGCIDQLGLILRAEIIWSKPNGLPESVTDRVRRSHEQFFHFVKQPRYYTAVDEIRESYEPDSAERKRRYGNNPGRDGLAGLRATGIAQHGSNGVSAMDVGGSTMHPLGKLPGSVWTIPERESLVRDVLAAVAAGSLTVDEGERLLCVNASCPMCGLPRRVAGNGRAGGTIAVTAKPPQADTEKTGLTESPTSSSLVPSQTDSLSTTSAETPDASTPTTSSPSPSLRTSDGPTPNEPRAVTDIVSPMLTSSGTDTGSFTSGAVSARSPVCVCSGGVPSVWSVPSEPLQVPKSLGVDHFAAFPTELPRRLILGWSPPGICTVCGQGRRPLAIARHERPMGAWNPDRKTENRPVGLARPSSLVQITGYACACSERNDDSPSLVHGIRRCTICLPPTRPSVILDPFGGTGTVALVARALGRVGLSVDLSGDYSRLAVWRTQDPGELAKALRVEKPPQQIPDQLGLFEDVS